MTSMIKILIVEDELIPAFNIAKDLERQGYAITDIVSSGEAALQSIMEHCPDLVLMDIQLQGEIDGIETTKRIYQNNRIPVIYMTAYTDSSTLERARLTDPKGYLKKPLRPQDIYSKIEQALSHS